MGELVGVGIEYGVQSQRLHGAPRDVGCEREWRLLIGSRIAKNDLNGRFNTEITEVTKNAKREWERETFGFC
jgi:hypothetical protein